MVEATSIFGSFARGLQEKGLNPVEQELDTQKVLSDAEIIDRLNKLFECIKTLDDYEQLIIIMDSLRSSMSLRFMFLFFEALVFVEIRIWGNAGMEIPMEEIMDHNIDLLSDEYKQFTRLVDDDETVWDIKGGFFYNLEKEIIDYTKEKGYFYDPEKYAFIKRRNSIYANYIVRASSIISAKSDKGEK